MSLDALRPGDDARVLSALGEVLAGLRAWRSGAPPIVFPLRGVARDTLARLDEALGHGEVEGDVRGRHRVHLEETGLPGLWRVQDEVDGTVSDYLEISDVPAIVRAADEAATSAELSIGAPPPEATSVLPLLAELRHQMRTWTPGRGNHVLALSSFPMTDADLRTLEQRLGHGPVVAWSSGYRRCRVELTGHRHVWRVRYFGPMDGVLLDSLEVGDVPLALVAAPEDFEDSAQRLAEQLGA